MKRGLITWDRAELPASVLEARLNRAKAALAERDLPALLVYTDVWRSDQARFLTNFMPYWNRSLVVIPRDGAPVLLCALSPRVYPWIRSVTVFEEIRPASKLLQTLSQLCTERNWKKIGVLDLPSLPYEIHSKLDTEAVDVPSQSICAPDESEIAMRRTAAGLARKILEQELSAGAGTLDHHFIGRLERAFRRAGAEDLVILVSSDRKAPAPAKGAMLGEEYSVAVALEYRGHWVKVARPQTSSDSLRKTFEAALLVGSGGHIENLCGESIYALHVQSNGLFYGDTCIGKQPL